MSAGQPQQSGAAGGADSAAWDARYAAKELVWGAEPNRWVVEEAGGLPPGRALDLAAGEGRNALWLAAGGWQTTAVDFSSVAVERGRSLAERAPAGVADRMTWACADACTWTSPDGAFDLVVVAYLQLPADRRRAALQRAAEAVAPGGTLLVIGHDSTNLSEGVGGPQDPQLLFGPQDVTADLDGTGLAVVRAERVRRPAQGPGGEPAEAIDALVRMHRPQS